MAKRKFFTAMIVAAAVFFTCPVSSSADDFFESIIKGVTDFGETVANAKLVSVGSDKLTRSERTALVSRPDMNRVGTAIIRTHGGLTFQVNKLNIDSQPSIRELCELAEELRMFPINNEDQTGYKVRMNFVDLSQRDGSLSLSNLLSAGLDAAVNDSKAGRHKIRLRGLSGQSLDGQRWSLRPSAHRIREIIFVGR